MRRVQNGTTCAAPSPRVPGLVRATITVLARTLVARRTARTGIGQLRSRAGAATAVAALADSILRDIDALDRATGPATATGPVVSAGLAVQFQSLFGALVGDGGYGSGSVEGRPSAARVARARELENQWVTFRTQAATILGTMLNRLNGAAAQAGVSAVTRPPGIRERD